MEHTTQPERKTNADNWVSNTFMIKCVFFDFDDVLRNWDYELDGLEENFGIPLDVFREIAFAPENVGPAIRGEISDEEWRNGVCQKLVERFPQLDAVGAWKVWSTRTGEIVPEVLEIITACKSNVPIGMMTNATSKLNYDLKIHGIDDLFDYVVNASEIGSIKPEPAIFLHALKLAGIEPYEAFFTDDKAENVEAAVQLGYIGHVFENAAGLRAALTDAGVL